MSTAEVAFIHRQDRTPAPAEHEVAGMYRMRRLIEPALAAESCLLLGAGQLDELEKSIPSFANGTADAYLAHRAFYVSLLRPAATHWDLLVLRPLWDWTDTFGMRLRRRFPHDIVREACIRHLRESERIVTRTMRAVS